MIKNKKWRQIRNLPEQKLVNPLKLIWSSQLIYLNCGRWFFLFSLSRCELYHNRHKMPSKAEKKATNSLLVFWVACWLDILFAFLQGNNQPPFFELVYIAAIFAAFEVAHTLCGFALFFLLLYCSTVKHNGYQLSACFTR